MERKIIKEYCTSCENESTFHIVEKEQIIVVRKEPIKVNVCYLSCDKCNDEVISTKHCPDPLILAYDKYREKHRMLKPDEIKKCRESLGLTQIELAKLLGLGLSTISRYENGALQDSSHDSLIRLSLEPNNIIKLLEQSNGVLSESHKEKMLKGLADIQKESYSLEKVIEIIFSRENPDVENGFAKVNLTKLFNAMLFLSKDGVWKTKLNKLLFYIDFKHFKDYGVPITGLKYVHLPYGPCPNKYELLLASLYANENIYSDEIDFSNGNMGDLIKPLKEPDLNVYSTSELQILAYVKQYFKEFSAGAITEYSHKENGYLETNQGDFISYEYAKSLHL